MLVVELNSFKINLRDFVILEKALISLSLTIIVALLTEHSLYKVYADICNIQKKL